MLTCLRRLKLQGPFYDEFAQRPADAKPSATPLQQTSGTAAARPQAESLETVLKSVQGAVLAVLGAAVGPDKPLMEAGLDSLGEGACKRVCCSCRKNSVAPRKQPGRHHCRYHQCVKYACPAQHAARLQRNSCIVSCARPSVVCVQKHSCTLTPARLSDPARA